MAKTTEEAAALLLKCLEEDAKINSYELSHRTKVDHQVLVGAIKSLLTLGDVICAEQYQMDSWELTDEGRDFVANGSYEARLWSEVDPLLGTEQQELMNKVNNSSIGFSKAMACGWINIEKGPDGEFRVFRKVENITDTPRILLCQLSEVVDSKQLGELKKRKLIDKSVVKYYEVTKGTNFTVEIDRLTTELTAEMIQTGTWKTLRFKPYNFDAQGPVIDSGHLHPLMKVRTEIREIFLEMGFTEMPTNNFVESSFWNFDALFQPQQHPARDCHDTFFLKDPMFSRDFPQDFAEKVKAVHENGGDTGSVGYKYNWKIEEAEKNILRTHTTAISARMLYRLGQQEKFTPAKYFSIDRVFRNEAVDATHLAEFHQIEGLVADYNLTLGDLMGSLHSFFSKMGITSLRFKPTYNPYTEPSMEVFSYHNGLKKWVEVGNSGVFRPEMLVPMGLPKDVCVIAWGLSLERPTMIKYGINNIRDLVGHKVNLQMVCSNPLCRLDK